MNLIDKLEIDKEKTPSQMVFFREGTFYHAYEHSAYIASRLLPKLKVSCRYKKVAEGNVATVGFPVSSLPKYASGMNILQKEDSLLINVGLRRSTRITRTTHII